MLFSSLPILGLFSFVWALLAGWLAVRSYGRRTGSVPAVGSGARLGAAVAAVAGVIMVCLTLMALVVPAVRSQLEQQLKQSVETAGKIIQDPSTNLLLQWVATPQGFAMFVVLSLAVGIGILAVFAVIGGVVGAKTFKPGRIE